MMQCDWTSGWFFPRLNAVLFPPFDIIAMNGQCKVTQVPQVVRIHESIFVVMRVCFKAT